ncbi:hypothetical protein WISP_27156 [Willisornis vidua]|uniref:Uncharacterized protein n=1 Tax=Willisornis vidua TaxID=1566151 RepID=A0ABQ9DQW7_9PASS|nr:hypothetical protein WISP_27156 [Willisornis vidua]
MQYWARRLEQEIDGVMRIFGGVHQLRLWSSKDDTRPTLETWDLQRSLGSQFPWALCPSLKVAPVSCGYIKLQFQFPFMERSLQERWRETIYKNME